MPSEANRRALAVLQDMGTNGGEPPTSPQWDNNIIKTYERGFIYVIDHSLDFPALNGRTPKQIMHDERCSRVGAFFDTKTPYEVIYVNCNPGEPAAEWDRYWDDQLEDKTEDDLIIIYFHGHAYGLNRQYRWKFQRGVTIDAHNFITRLNSGVSDCNFFLDCFFHNRKERGLKWKLQNTCMTEFITSPTPYLTGGGQAIDYEGDWSKAFVRNMNDFMEGDIQKPTWMAPFKSIPTIMSKDHTIPFNQGSRFALQRSQRRDGSFRGRGIIRRLVVDPVMVWSKGEYEFFGQQIAGPEPEDEGLDDGEAEDEEDESDADDEGIGGHEYDADAHAAQLVRDQMDLDEDLAAGFL